jgi:enediyne biosynthesis protein E4
MRWFPGKYVALTALVLIGTLAAIAWIYRPAAEPALADPALFADWTDQAGLRFVHDAGSLPGDGPYFMPQIMGSGAALFDFDGDGRLDIYLLNNAGPKSSSTNRLYKNMPDGTFKDVTDGSGLGIAGWNMGIAIGDVNNDGLPDVLVTQFGGLKLFLNLGGGKFRDITQEAGLDSLLWGTSAAFLDYDRDGWLDLVVVNYLEYDSTRVCDNPRGRDYCPPRTFNGQIAKLYRNRSAGARPACPVLFEDVTMAAGLGKTPGYGLGVVCADFTGDGWPDILVANDEHPNFLWVNQHDGTFTEEAVSRGLAVNGQGQNQANMGVAIADVRGDGLFDVFVTHVYEEYHTLWRQTPRGLFRDSTAAAKLTAPKWKGTGFGTVLADFDHDGAVDLAIVNGKIAYTGGRVDPNDPATFWTHYAERNQLFLNDGKGRFTDVSLDNAPFCCACNVSRGLAWGDLDGDGSVDLLVTTIAGPARLFRNVAAKKGHWLMVRAVDPALGGRDALGAEIVVTAGQRRWLGWINPAGSYLCSNDPRAHFGLGSVTQVDAVDVTWPDGTHERFAPTAVDRVLLLRKGDGTKW